MTDTPVGTSMQYLLPALKFTQHDLDQNRQGLLSDAQRKRIWRRQSLITLFFGLLMAGMVVVLRIYGNGPQDDEGTQAIHLALRLTIAFIFLPFIGALLWLQSRTATVLRRGKVASSTGALHLYHRRRLYMLVMPDRSFPVDEWIYDGFTDGETYTIYYVTVIPYLHHHYLVSAEYHPTAPEKQKIT